MSRRRMKTEPVKLKPLHVSCLQMIRRGSAILACDHCWKVLFAGTSSFSRANEGRRCSL